VYSSLEGLGFRVLVFNRLFSVAVVALRVESERETIV
jgi:hypothetical protein